MRLANREYEAGGWRIAEVAPDFRLEDAWALPVRGAEEDFPALIELMSSLDPTGASASRATRALFAVRLRLGEKLGWDDDPFNEPATSTERWGSLRERLPADLRETALPQTLRATSFAPIYRTASEAAAELSNRTVHAVMHLAWVEQADGSYRGQMGVYVKPRGRLGRLYMAAIAPFRHVIVYPALLRQIERAWDARR
jgi:hypothetical protein